MNRLLKKLLCFILLLSMVCGCQKNDKLKVGVLQYVEHTSLNTIKDAFDQQMKSLGYDENIELIYKNAQGDLTNCHSIVQDFQNKDVDVIMAIATPSAMCCASVASDIPVVFAAVSDPIGAHLTSSLEKTDKNMTGTSDEIQVEQILNQAFVINPSLKRLGVIYNKGEANSVTNINKVKEYAKEHQLIIEETTITSLNEVQSAIEVLTTKCDAIFAPNDNMVASAMNVVSTTCMKMKIPLYVGADSMVQDGGFFSIGINYVELGKETANMVDKVLKGESIDMIPIKVFKDHLNIYVNENVRKQLEIELPSSLLEDESLMIIE